MDPQKKKYLDEILYNQTIFNCKDVDLSEIARFFESNEGSRYLDHRSRFIETYIRICRYLKLKRDWKIAETGHLSGVSKFLSLQGYDVAALAGDFRYRIESDNDSVDLLISLEVMEHIKDKESTNFDDIVIFNFSGVETFVSEIWRCVRPGGFVVLSTPNASSMINLIRLLSYESPMMFWPHVKEYPPGEVLRLFETKGFTIRYWETIFGLFYLDSVERNRLLKELFMDRGASAEHRGDIGLYIFEKPLSPTG